MTGPPRARELLAAEQADVLSRLAGLEREYAGVLESAGQAGTDDEHDPDGATLAWEREHVAALLTGAREHLARIQAALTRLDEGRYGLCETCGQPIDPARLAARPATPSCLNCAGRR